jgi:hypothetical protein
MASLVGVVTAVAFVVVWNAFTHRQSAGRAWSPLFNCTAAAAVFLPVGLSGYTMSRHDRFVTHTAWTGHVIWWEVGVGLVAAVTAANFWRRGLELPSHRPAIRV